jgi:tetratricopeptide (TPR) repeat protein
MSEILVPVGILAAILATVLLVSRRRRRRLDPAKLHEPGYASAALDARLASADAIAQHLPVATIDDTVKALEAKERHCEAEVFAQRALAVREAELGPAAAEIGDRLRVLARLRVACGARYMEAYEEARPLLARATSIYEALHGPDDLRVAEALSEWAGGVVGSGLYAEGATMLRRVLAIREQHLGADHPQVAAALMSLYQAESAAFSLAGSPPGRHAELEPVLRRALQIREAALGTSHPDTANTLFNLAHLLDFLGRGEEALTLHLRALHIREQAHGSAHEDLADSLAAAARLYERLGRHDESEPFFRRALAMREQILGHDAPDTVAIRNNLSMLLRNIRRR